MVAGDYLREPHPEIFHSAASREHFSGPAFTGYDSDAAMARIGSMNLMLHGVDNPTMERGDSLGQSHPTTESFSLVLANPPFAGSLDFETMAKDLLGVVKTKKAELLFLVLMLRMLKNGGRAAVIVPCLAYAGIAISQFEIKILQRSGWKIMVVAVFVLFGTFIASALIAHFTLGFL